MAQELFEDFNIQLPDDYLLSSLTPSDKEIQKIKLEELNKLLPKIPSNINDDQISNVKNDLNFFEKNFPITSDQLKSVWESDLGLADESKDKLRWLLGDPNKTLIGKFNNYLIDTGSKGIDLAVRSGTSLGFLASGVAGDGLNLFNKLIDQDAGGAGERLTRDFNIFMIGRLGESGSFRPSAKKSNTIISEKTGEEITDVFKYARENADKKSEILGTVEKIVDDEINVIKKNDKIIGENLLPENVNKRTEFLDDIVNTNKSASEGIPQIKMEIPEVKVPKTEIPKVEIPIIEPIAEPIVPLERKPALPIETTKKITEAAKKFFEEENIKLDPKKPVSLQIQELWQSGKYDIPTVVRKLAEDNKITAEEFTTYIYPSVRKSAQELNAYSQLSKYIRDQLDPSGAFDTGNTKGFFTRLNNVYRGLLVTRLSTSIRNYISQSARLGLDTIQSALDYALQSAIKPFVDPIQFQKNRVSPMSNLQGLINNFTQLNPKGGFAKHKELKNLTNKILDEFKSEKDRLFLNYASDLKSGKGIKGAKDVFGKVEGAVDLANIVNKTQEFITRRAVFLARLNEAVKANPKYYRGRNLDRLIKENELNLIRPSDIATAVDKALDVTFAKDFNITKGGYETFAAGLIKLVNSAPFLLTNIIPFPRFLMNSLKFHFDYSPLGILSLMSKNERAAIARGNTSVLSKAILGTGMLTAAIALRNQSYAGDKWYEFNVGKRTVDVRPFNPFAAYLFVGDAIKRYQNGTLRNLDLKGIASVFAGIRGTTGLYLVDKTIDFVKDPKLDADAIKSGLGKLFGETLGGFLTPLQNITDVMAQYNPEMRVVRDTSGQEITGAIERRFPLTRLPAVTSATSYIIDANGIPRAAPLKREDPLVTQVTGVGFITAKNPAEKELDRLGFESREIFKSTGIPEVDRAYKDKLSVAIGFGLSSIVSSPQYQLLNNSSKSFVVKEFLSSARESTKKEIQKDTSLSPFLLELDIKKLDKDRLKLLDDSVGLDHIKLLLNELQGKKK